MCPGKEYARMEILVFMNNLVKRFKWEAVIPHENIIIDPMPVPVNGLPVHLFFLTKLERRIFGIRSTSLTTPPVQRATTRRT
ncbi:unnamed protein product [Sphenostylis stenocarpa]|uniref:Cytochrome P450 n=1 Tax=Sphenostylis stenocarpa TaxID=92480 RepID=A0AA86SAX8_9FABA|nr:unnamed protein product [Sphenostylis stenocarpa]